MSNSRSRFKSSRSTPPKRRATIRKKSSKRSHLHVVAVDAALVVATVEDVEVLLVAAAAEE